MVPLKPRFTENLPTLTDTCNSTPTTPYMSKEEWLCLFDRARRVTTTEERLKEEEKHLEQGLVNNGYPLTLIKSPRNLRHRMKTSWKQRVREKKSNLWYVSHTWLDSVKTSGESAGSLASGRSSKRVQLCGHIS